MTIASIETADDCGSSVTATPAAKSPAVPEALRAARAVTTVGVLQLCVLLVMLVRSKVLALLLHPEGVGIVSTIDQLLQFVAQVSAFSLIAAPTRFLARTLTEGVDATRRMYAALLKLLAASTVAGAAIAAVAMAVGRNPLGPELAVYKGAAVIAALTAPVFALSGYLANTSAVASGYSTTSVFLLINAAGSLAGSVLGLRAWGIPGLYYGNLAAAAVCTVSLAVYLWKTVGLKPIVPGSGLRDLVRGYPDLLRYCATSYVLTFAQPLAFLVVRAAMMKRLGSAETGLFQAAFTISSVASAILTQAVRVYLEPIVNTHRESGPKIAAANEFQRPFAAMVLAGTLPLVLFPSLFVAILFTPAFGTVAGIMFIFVLADCVFLSNQIYATVLMAVDNFRGFFLANMAGHLVLCAGVWLLTGRYGLVGVACSFVSSRVVVFVIVQWCLVREHGISMSARTAGLVVYSLAVLLTLGWFFSGAPVSGATDVLLRLGLYALFVAGMFSFLTHAERSAIATTYRRFAAAG